MEWIAAGLFFVGLSILVAARDASARVAAEIREAVWSSSRFHAEWLAKGPEPRAHSYLAPDRRGPVIAPQRVVR